MRTLAVIEIEEGSLSLTFGVRVGNDAHVTRCHRVQLPDTGREAMVNVLRPLAGEFLQDVDGVHVILGDRRTQHFVAALPKMPHADAVDFAVREGMRMTSMPNAAELLVAPRLVRTTKGGKLVVGATALPRNVWEPLREAFVASGIDVLGLHSSEACLAAGGFAALRRAGLLRSEARTGERFAVVECGGGRARFVLCDGRSAVQVRRFMVGTAENNPDALATQLAMELPRTVEWLRESGHQAPTTLVLGNRVGVPDESLDTIRGDLERVVRAPAVTMTGAFVPSLASVALLREIASGAQLPSLLATPRFPPRTAWLRTLWLPAAVAAGGLLSLIAIDQHRATIAARGRIAETLEEREAVRERLAEANVLIRTPFQSDARINQLAMALGMRRPVSRLVAEVANGATTNVLLDGLQFASDDRVVVTGVVTGGTRSAALSTLADFATFVRSLPYLDPDAQEDVGEVIGQTNQFRFRLSMAWRST